MKIHLRTLTIEDKQDIFDNIFHDEKVFEAFLGKYVENIEDFHFQRTLDYFEKNACFYYGIELLENHKCIGMIFETDHHENTIEIGYAIGREYWNKGIVTEALTQVIDELKIKYPNDRIIAGAFKENIASWRVMEKSGMVYTHTVEKELEWHGKWHDVVYYEVKR